MSSSTEILSNCDLKINEKDLKEKELTDSNSENEELNKENEDGGLKKQTTKLSIEDDIRKALEMINIDQITNDSNNNQINNQIANGQLNNKNIVLETTTPIILNPPKRVDEPETLDDVLEDARWMMKEFLNGKFQTIMEHCKKRAHISIFHEAGSAMFDFLDAFLALDKEKLNNALASMKKASERANSLRRKTGIVGYLVRGDFTNYTDMEIHAELIFAITELMCGLLIILSDQTIYGAVNACLKAKTCYSCLKNCEYALEDKLEWESELSRKNLESGMCLGIGAFDLILSFCPTVVTRILDYVGFNSDRLEALAKLKRCIEHDEAIFFEVCSISLTVYHSFLSYFYGIGELNEPFFELTSARWSTSQTNIEILNVGRGSRDLVYGRPDTAIEYFQTTLSGTSKLSYPQLNYVCYWQLVWAYVMRCEWSEAARYAGLLKDNCTWSRAMFTYLHAIFLFQHMESNKLSLLEPIIAECLSMVPKLKRHLGGKRAFQFNMMSRDPNLLKPMLNLVEEKLKIHKKTLGRTSLDKYCYLVFMKGVILRHLKQTDEAIELFNEVLSCKSRINEQRNVLAQSCFELGLIYYDLADYKQSKKWVKKAKSDYSGYVTQVLIEYRVNWVLDIIKAKKKELRLIEKSAKENADKE